MKRIFLMFAAAGLLLASPACKKGENDPFLSLKSRKGRLAGEYTIAAWYAITTSENEDGDVFTNITDIKDGSGTRTTTNHFDGEDPVTVIRNVVITDEDYVINKDGTWSRKLVTTTTWTEEGDGFFIDEVEYTEIRTLEESGTWSFLGGQPEEFKNKERVLFSLLEVKENSERETVVHETDGGSTTDEQSESLMEEFSEGEMTMIYEIDMLKSKEMTFIQKGDGRYEGEYVYGDGSSYEYSMMRTGEVEMELIQD